MSCFARLVDLSAKSMAWMAIFIMGCMMVKMQSEMQALREEAAQMRSFRHVRSEQDASTPTSDEHRPSFVELFDNAASQKSFRSQEASAKSGRREPERRLGNIMADIVAYGSMAKGAGCVSLALSGGAVTLDISGKNCNSLACPLCYLITAGHASNLLTLSTCSSAYVTSEKQLNGLSTAVAEFTFINADTSNYALIYDGANTYAVGPKSYAHGYCYSGGSNVLYFTSPYYYNGIHTGTGSSGTGASMTGAGALTLDDDLTVSGAAAITGAVTGSSTVTVAGASTFNGAVTLGDATGDTVTFNGNIAAGTTNPAFDLSGSTGTFATSTGSKTFGGTSAVSFGGTLAVTGAATFNGDVNLGNLATDTVTLYAAVATSTNAAVNLGTSALTFGAGSGASLAVSGDTTLNGDTALGNAATDTVTYAASVAATGAVAFDISGSTGSFTAPGSTLIVSGSAVTIDQAITATGALTVAGAATFNGIVGLGDGTADTVTVKGNVAASGTPTLNFGTSAFTCGTAAIQGAATLSTTLTVAGDTTLQGGTALGNAGTDAISLVGSLTATSAATVDLSAATGNTLRMPSALDDSGTDRYVCIHDGSACVSSNR